MKSTSKMMVIAAVFLVAAALLVAPGAARSVGDGDTTFQYEDLVDFGTLNTDINKVYENSTLERLVYLDGDDNEQKDVKLNDDFTPKENFTDYDFGGYFGTYYAEITAEGGGTVLLDGEATGFEKEFKVFIREPTLKADVVLADDHSSSVAGKTITDGTRIVFKVQTGDVGSEANLTAKVAIELESEDGTVINMIPYPAKENKDPQDLAMDLDKSTVYIDGGNEDGLDLRGLKGEKYVVRAVWKQPKSFDDYAPNSEATSFTLSTVDLSIEANKENVVRNNDFSVTIRGDSQHPYYVYIDKVSSLAADEYPMVKPGQNGVMTVASHPKFFEENGEFKPAGTTGGAQAAVDAANDDIALYANKTYALVNTTAGGTRTVGFSTSGDTKDRSFTINVIDAEDKDTDDDVKVKVEEGEVTVTAEGAGNFYIGEEIKLSGTNTDGDYVYLFMTGPNLGKDRGVKIDDITVDADEENGKLERSVESDDTWEYRWDTSNLGGVLDAGTYTIYAVSKDVTTDSRGKEVIVDKKNLKDVKYQTIGIQLRKPYLTLDDIPARVAKGDEFVVTGIAEGKPDKGVQIWILGKNFRGIDDQLAHEETVEDDGTFEYTLERDQTEDLTSGQYFLIVQHPMTDGEFNVKPVSKDEAKDKGGLDKPSNYVIRDGSGNYIDLGRLSASQAATALVDALNSQNCDDTYTKASFQVDEALVSIDAIGDQFIDTTFTITGTTNLAVGNELTVSLSSASFGPASKTEASGFSARTGQVAVEAGDDYNTWSYEVDTADFKPDQYTVTVESVDADLSTSQTFNVFEGEPTPTETTPVDVTTTAPVDVTPTATEPTPTTTPGFGALVALVGLGAVAFLVMRRD